MKNCARKWCRKVRFLSHFCHLKEVYEWKESGSTNLIIETQWFDIIKEHLEMGLTVTNSLLGPLFRLE